jgi:hypothetical protein
MAGTTAPNGAKEEVMEVLSRRLGTLHVYGQPAQHDEVYLVGDHAGLIHLRDALVLALRDGVGTGVAMSADGEGYDLIVIRCDSQAYWEHLRLPYTADWLIERERDKAHPASLLAQEDITQNQNE